MKKNQMETIQPSNAKAYTAAVKRQVNSEKIALRATRLMFRCLFVVLSLNLCIKADAQNTLDGLNLPSTRPAYVAFSLRKLSNAYTGPVVRIRRSNDNELRDVYFDVNGVLSLSSQVSAAGGGTATTTTLQQWIGANNGTVAIWYDQSGNARNISHSTAAQQPTIVSAGSILVNASGRPRLSFNGSNWLFGSFFLTTQPVTVSLVWQLSSGNFQEIGGWGSNSGLGTRYGIWIHNDRSFGVEVAGKSRRGG